MQDNRSSAGRSTILQAAEALARERLAGDTGGHDWWHIHRVRQLALRLAHEEHADPFVTELAVLLHDLADRKLVPDVETARADLRERLREWGTDDDSADHVMNIVATLSFGDGKRPPMNTLEGQVVQDADRLDAIGAIGIARTFAYSGWSGRPMHVPSEGSLADAERRRAELPGEDGAPRRESAQAEAGGDDGSPADDIVARIRTATGDADGTLVHFADKLLLLRDRMNTASARRIADGRHRFLETFADRFLEEWDGLGG